MLTYLRAVAWLRWRTFINTLTRTGSRDAGERTSRLLDQLLPIVLLIILIPSAVASLVVGGLVGWSLDRGIWSATPYVFTVARWMLTAITVTAIVAPLTISVSRRDSSQTRFLILPVPRRILHRADVMAGVVDPWNLVATMFVIGLPIGLAISGRLLAAMISFMAALAFVILLLSIGAFCASAMQLVFRSRRRGEAITVVGMILLSGLGMLPALLTSSNRPRRGQPRERAPVVRPAWTYAAPSDQMALAVERATKGAYRSSAAPLAGALAYAGVSYTLSWLVYRRLLETPETSGARRQDRGARASVRRLPGLSRGASAAAWLTVRMVTRTMRGRMALLSPPFMIVTVSTMLAIRTGRSDLPPAVARSAPLALSAFGAFIGLLSLGPIIVNQFGVDGAGLTRQFLAPLTDLEILRAKAVGGFMCAFVMACLAALAGILVDPSGSIPLHLAVIPAALSVYWLSAPVNAALSIALPKAVDLGVLGRAGQPNQLAGLGGLAATAFASAFAAAIVVFTMLALRSAIAALAALTVWLVICWAVGLLAMPLLAPFLRSRRENLGLVAEGK